MENPITRISAQFQYKIPSLRTLAVMRGRPRRNSCTFLQRSWSRKAAVDVNTFLRAPFWEKGAEKRLVECYYITITACILVVVVVAVVVDDDTYDWSYLSSDHPFQVYYKVRQLILLQSAVVCYYKVRQVLLQSAIGIKKCGNFITKCDRTDSVALKPLV